MSLNRPSLKIQYFPLEHFGQYVFIPTMITIVGTKFQTLPKNNIKVEYCWRTQSVTV